MAKKIILPALLLLLMVTSCKKHPDVIKKVTEYKSLDFTVSAAAPMKIALKITRPATDGSGVDVQLVYIAQRNITTPYHYKEERLQIGDHINIEVTTDPGQLITGVLKINEDSKSNNYTNLNHADGVSIIVWDNFVD